jgi:hypothetical protein
MVKAKRARTAETPTQPSSDLMLRAPEFYPDRRSSNLRPGPTRARDPSSGAPPSGSMIPMAVRSATPATGCPPTGQAIWKVEVSLGPTETRDPLRASPHHFPFASGTGGGGVSLGPHAPGPDRHSCRGVARDPSFPHPDSTPTPDPTNRPDARWRRDR